MMGILYDSTLGRIQSFIAGLGGPDRAIDLVPWSRATIYRAVKDGKLPKSETLLNWLESQGARIVFPDERPADTTRDVVFVQPRRSVAVVDGVPNPVPEDYMAVPMASGPAAAGEGMLVDDGVQGWVLIYRRALASSVSSNLLAVEVGDGQESMVPTLHPGDIVLVDREQWRPDEGAIYLVRQPDHGYPVAVKRVNTTRKNGDCQLFFSSDNLDKKRFPPKVYSLAEDFDGDFRRAIVGRVVWAWSDMARK